MGGSCVDGAEDFEAGMKPSEQLSEFVRTALAQGAPAVQLRQALADAGWSEPEISAALDGWQSRPGLPPVPRPRPYASAREALLYGLLFVSLGMVAWHLCQLGMALIDRAIPDPAQGYGGNTYAERWSMAALIAFTPMFLLLGRRLARQGAGSRGRSLVRRWFASLTLLGASLVFLGDAVVALHALLGGELTARFTAKALLVAMVAGLVLAYYRDELDD